MGTSMVGISLWGQGPKGDWKLGRQPFIMPWGCNISETRGETLNW